MLFFTISIARSTPAQKPLGAAKKFLNFYFSFVSFLKKGIKKILHATRKKKLLNIVQKLPILEIIKHNLDMINKIHPIKLIFLLLIFFQFYIIF